MNVNVYVYKLTVIDPTTVISQLSCEIEDATVVDESEFEFCLSGL